MTSHHPTALLKFGGEIVRRPEVLVEIMHDVAKLHAQGWRFVLCHGGGPQATDLSARLGLETVKVGGRRVTDAATLQVMKQALAGEASIDVVAAALSAGVQAVGIAGVSAGLVTASRRPPKVVSGGGDEPVDFGLVGDIEKIQPAVISALWQHGFTPVVSSLGVQAPAASQSGPLEVYNINADTVASSLAAALGVDHLFLMTDVPGVLLDRHDPGSRIPRMTRAQALAKIADGTIAGGMIPKVEDALSQFDAGVKMVHIVGAQAGVLAQEAQEPGSRGTALMP